MSKEHMPSFIPVNLNGHITPLRNLTQWPEPLSLLAFTLALSKRHLKLTGLCVFVFMPALAETPSDIRFPETRSNLQLEDSQLPTSTPNVLLHHRSKLKHASVSTLSNGWSHSFDILLTTDETKRTIFGAQGGRHEFKTLIAQNDVTVHYHSESPRITGILSSVNGTYMWTRSDKSIVEFTGSLPTSIRYPENVVQRMNYRGGLLLSVDLRSNTTPWHRLWDFAYENGQLKQVSSAGEQWHDYIFDSEGVLSIQPAAHRAESFLANAPDTMPSHNVRPVECVASEPFEQGCDSYSSPTPDGFETTTQIPGAIRIDVRPSSCQSYFTDFYGTVRGQEIEQGLTQHSRYQSMNSTVRSFPIIDFYGDGEVRVVRSRDLASRTLSSETGEPLFNQLIRDGRDIHQKLLAPLAEHGILTVEENGRTTTIVQSDVEHVVLEVIVRYDLATPAQIAQIEKAKQVLMDEFDVELQIIEIP